MKEVVVLTRHLATRGLTVMSLHQKDTSNLIHFVIKLNNRSRLVVHLSSLSDARQSCFNSFSLPSFRSNFKYNNVIIFHVALSISHAL